MTTELIAHLADDPGMVTGDCRKKPLNDETTFKERTCQLMVAMNDRRLASKREDVAQTTDSRAFEEMFEYVKSDNQTLDTHRDSKIADFYTGRSIFITGASGFVGKCLLEKLLRSCPGLRQVFILMRPKRGLEVGERVESLIRCELFERLRSSPDGQKQLNKVVAIRGDITKPFFGLSSGDIELLSSRVSLVFHSAATVKFVEPLKVAVENNVVSVENLVDLASKLSSLEALVHVSTAYSNCNRKQVDEVFYEAPIEADRLIDMARWMKPDILEKISPALLEERPNTYTYTKAVAEALLVERARKLLPNIPIAMVRPSIVAGIWRQPICGWVDNFNGPTGVILSLMTGALQAMLACPDYCADIVPVDIVANLIICAAWQVHRQHRDPATKLHQEVEVEPIGSIRIKDISVYNCVSGTLNPVLWRDFSKYIKQIGLVYPCNNLMRRPDTLLISNEYLFNIFNFINHATVAYTVDFVLKFMGRKPKLVIVYKRLMKMIQTLKPFTTNQWLFNCSNVTCLYEGLTPVDKEIFNFDIRQVRWDDYLRRYYVGAKLFALKDDPNKVVSARHKLRKMAIGSQLMQMVFLFFVYYCIIRESTMEHFIIESLYSLY